MLQIRNPVHVRESSCGKRGLILGGLPTLLHTKALFGKA